MTILGVQKFKYGEIEEENRIGVVTGLAWTEVGGEILKIESAVMPGKGKMQITGKLGEVMQESVKGSEILHKIEKSRIWNYPANF